MKTMAGLTVMMALDVALGYRDQQINKIVLRSHHILLPMGILLSVPCVYVAADAFFLLMVDYA